MATGWQKSFKASVRANNRAYEQYRKEKDNRCPFNLGQEVEWLTRPTGDGGYLRGIVMQISSSRIKIKVQSPKTGEFKEKWAEPKYLRAVGSG